MTKKSSQLSHQSNKGGQVAEIYKTATRLLGDGLSFGQIWGELLLAENLPNDIALALSDLQSRHSKENRNLDPEFAFLEQQELLSQLAVREGLVPPNQLPSTIAKQLQLRLNESKIVVLGSEEKATTEISKYLQQIGICNTTVGLLTEIETTAAGTTDISKEIEKVLATIPSLAICVTSSNCCPISREVNRICIRDSIPALYIHQQGLQVQIGPFVLPKDTACFECFLIRRDSTLAPWERKLLKNSNREGQLKIALGVDWVIVEVAKFLLQVGEPITRGRMLFIDYFAGLPETHSVLRLPKCPVCGVVKRPSYRLWENG
jgi:bacteriocin biosynthesis cyclodehydratase domain-containing protein